MMNTILIDTCILIDILRNDTTAIIRLQQESLSSKCVISTLTEMELIVGCQNKSELRNLEKFLEQFTGIILDQAISIRATQLLKIYNLSYGLLIPDALIASTALELGIPLLSKNQKDYRFIANLQLLSFP